MIKWGTYDFMLDLLLILGGLTVKCRLSFWDKFEFVNPSKIKTFQANHQIILWACEIITFYLSFVKVNWIYWNAFKHSFLRKVVRGIFQNLRVQLMKLLIKRVISQYKLTTNVYAEPDLSAVSSCGCGLWLDSTWLVIVLDVFEGPQTSCHITTLTLSTQQQRMTRNGHNHFATSQKISEWQESKKGREGALFVGKSCPVLLEQIRTTQSQTEI